jgi:hypothetical protein
MKQGNWLGAINTYEAGLSNVDQPSPLQRLLRRLLSTPRKLIGGG